MPACPFATASAVVAWPSGRGSRQVEGAIVASRSSCASESRPRVLWGGSLTPRRVTDVSTGEYPLTASAPSIPARQPEVAPSPRCDFWPWVRAFATDRGACEPTMARAARPGRRLDPRTRPESLATGECRSLSRCSPLWPKEAQAAHMAWSRQTLQIPGLVYVTSGPGNRSIEPPVDWLEQETQGAGS